MKKRVYLSLGSNLGDRRAHLDRALEEMQAAGIEVKRVSSIYKTEPVDTFHQPWFLNCVVETETEMMPRQLLRSLQRIEHRAGRKRLVRHGPRTMDIDILFYENHVMHSPELTIPHPRLLERRFVLEPLREIAPEARHPASRRTVRELWAESRGSGRVEKVS